jgi:methionine synthase I (cobalamin-dependent)
MDAAMGTRLVALGLDLRTDNPALWNLTHPDHVLELHRRDVSAGSGAVLTNTFGANRSWLARFGRAGAVESINRRAVELARQAAGPDRFVFGCLGPTAARPDRVARFQGDRAGGPVADRAVTQFRAPRSAPWHSTAAAAEQAAILVDAGVDALCFETFTAAELEPVLREITVPVPLVVSLWHWPDPPDPAVRRLLELGASVIGMNCQAGIDAAVAFAERLSGVAACPLLIKPSAGEEGRSGGSPAAFAAAVPRLLELNVRLLGGCCGTTELHVAALADAVHSRQNERGVLR